MLCCVVVVVVVVVLLCDVLITVLCICFLVSLFQDLTFMIKELRLLHCLGFTIENYNLFEFPIYNLSFKPK